MAVSKNVAKTASAAKSGQQAVTKVAKLDKGAKAAPAKPAKTAPVSGQQAKARSQFSGKKIALTAEGKAATPRGNAGLLWDAIVAHKNVDDAIGTEYARTGGKYDGETFTVQASDLAYFVRRGLIEIA